MWMRFVYLLQPMIGVLNLLTLHLHCARPLQHQPQSHRKKERARVKLSTLPEQQQRDKRSRLRNTGDLACYSLVYGGPCPTVGSLPTVGSRPTTGYSALGLSTFFEPRAPSRNSLASAVKELVNRIHFVQEMPSGQLLLHSSLSEVKGLHPPLPKWET